MKAVTGQGNEVSDINENEILQLDLIEDIPLNFRIACENKLTPCKLHFSYKTAGTIEVHVLCGKKEVCKKGQPRLINVSEFVSPFIYLKIVSKTGCEVELQIKFGSPALTREVYRPKKLTSKFDLPEM